MVEYWITQKLQMKVQQIEDGKVGVIFSSGIRFQIKMELPGKKEAT